ncbi:MAG: hypothetical protein PVG56_13665 [Anaerolineae bacterium]
MSRLLTRWSPSDLQFVVKILVPEGDDPEHLVEIIRDDQELLDAMLQDERLFQQLMADDEVLVSASPEFFFQVLLMRARRDMEQELYTIERRHQQKVVLFDASRVVDLMADRTVCDYLAAMLASYTRVNSVTIPIRIRPGIWRRIRVNDLDVDSLIRYAQMLDEDLRFATYQRIGDACLFLTGIFPEYIGARQSYPQSNQPRPRLRGSLVHSLEDYEAYGRTFYRLAARHQRARPHGLDRVLATLSEQFILAEKPLSFLTERYLAMRKHRLFEF